MFQFEDDLSLAASVLFSNVWLLTDNRDRRFLIDTGDAGERWMLRRSLRLSGLTKPGDITAVLLTHWHRDHAGNAAWLRRTFQCPIMCHEADAAFLEGAADAPRLMDVKAPPWLKPLHMVQDLFPARCEVDETFTSGPWKYGFEIIPTPGHTPGSVMIFHRPTATLFSGDSILAGTAPMRLGENFSLAVPEFSSDVESCRAATKRFIASAPEIKRLCAGHGPPASGDINAKLHALAAGKVKKPLLRAVRNLAAVPSMTWRAL